MAVYYKDPYRMYYEQLCSEKKMTSSAMRANSGSEDLVTKIVRFQSQVESSKWKELGYYELVNTSIPSLISMVQKFRNNMLELSKATSHSIDVLLPILEQIKDKDEQLDGINSEISRLVEPKIELFVSEQMKNEYNSEYSQYINKKRKLEERANSLDIELKSLVQSADREINLIKQLNSNIQKFDSLSVSSTIVDTVAGLDLGELNIAQLIDYKNKGLNITNVEYFKSKDVSMSGNYFIVTFSNGKKLYLHQQKDGTYGNWGKIDIGKEKTWNGGGGCSVFSTSAAFSWLLGQYVPPRAVMMAGGGQLDGIRTIATDHKPVNINGEEYIIDADVSETNIPYGSTSNKEEVVNDWYTTLENGGAVVIAVGGRNQPIREYFDDGKKVRIVESSDSINQRTGITSQGGHVIAMVGLDENGKIIFADSIYDVGDDGNDKVLDSRAYDKGLTLNDFYDLYGGNGKTYIESSGKTYVTIKNASITKAIQNV